MTVDGTASVAGRDAYELVLQPRDTRSLVGDVRLAVDSETGVPLRVQVNAAGSTGRPAFETAFTSVSFEKPSASVFRFSPPPGATVSELGSSARRRDRAADRPGGTPGSEPRVIGSGWTAVLETTGVSLPSGGGGEHDGESPLGALTRAMTPVSGAYGHGQLLRTKLALGAAARRRPVAGRGGAAGRAGAGRAAPTAVAQ